MPLHIRKILLAAAAGLALVMGVSACKSGLLARTAYNNAPFLAMNRIDSYFDLNSSQEDFLKPRLKRLHTWHKTNQMPQLLKFIDDAKVRTADGLTPGELDWVYKKTEGFSFQAVNRGVDDAASFLATVEPRQINHLQGKMKEYNKELEEYVALPAAQRQKKREERLLKTMRDWVGDLTSAQERKIVALSRTMPDTGASYLNYRKTRQAQFLALLRSKPGKAKIKQQLINWSVHRKKHYPPAYNRDRARWEKRFREVVLEVDKILTPAQRKKAASRIESLMVDFVPQPVNF